MKPLYNLDLEPLGPYNRKPWKSQKAVVFEISSIKHFAIFTRKHLCWGLFLIKLQAFRPATFLKRDSDVSCGYCELYKNIFFTENLRWLLLTVLPLYSEVSWVFLVWFAPSRAFELDQKLMQNVAQIVIYYHVTKQFLSCLN